MLGFVLLLSLEPNFKDNVRLLTGSQSTMNINFDLMKWPSLPIQVSKFTPI